MNNFTRFSILLLCLVLTSYGFDAHAQFRHKTKKVTGNEYVTYDFRSNHLAPEDADEYVDVFSDTITVYGHQTEKKDSILDPHQIVTNRFLDNWFVFATGGAHTFIGDYSSTSSFGGTISPDWSVGVGKWFTPGLALKLEFIRSNSRGYTEYLTGHYGYGPIILENGIPYRKMKTSWWDINASILLNFTRMIYGYEGYNSPKRMNQFMAAFGFGGVHHLGFEHSYGSDNEWSGHVELQYSRFFTPKKQFSLDLKARAIFYQTNFDLEYGVKDYASNKWDSNIGIDLGFTYYLGKTRGNAWGSSITQVTQRDFTTTDIVHYKTRVIHDMGEMRPDKKVKNITFYVFYPNNYSGRNDAPIVEDATVNAIDYLAGGIFTQKKFADNDAALRGFNSGSNLHNVAVADIPTISATETIVTDGLPRGYEMQDNNAYCLSYPYNADREQSFKDKVGYYYAPIWDGLHEWHYRIDKETYKQQLVSSANYRDTECYGLNGHRGLDIIKERLNVDDGDYLVSFADVYAALNGNTGYVANFTDEATVNAIREVLDNGIFRVIEAHGMATSQDNYSGKNATLVGIERNQELANNRAETVRKWLMSNPKVNDAHSIVYIDDCSENVISPVSDPSTRGLNAKLNRCVKVRIQVIY